MTASKTTPGSYEVGYGDEDGDADGGRDYSGDEPAQQQAGEPGLNGDGQEQAAPADLPAANLPAASVPWRRSRPSPTSKAGHSQAGHSQAGRTARAAAPTKRRGAAK